MSLKAPLENTLLPKHSGLVSHSGIVKVRALRQGGVTVVIGTMW